MTGRDGNRAISGEGSVSDALGENPFGLHMIGKGVFCCFLLWMFGLFFRFQLIKSTLPGSG